MKRWAILFATLAIAFGGASTMAESKGKKGSGKAVGPACLNPLFCKPQPVPQRRKPAKEQFMRSAS